MQIFNRLHANVPMPTKLAVTASSATTHVTLTVFNNNNTITHRHIHHTTHSRIHGSICYRYFARTALRDKYQAMQQAYLRKLHTQWPIGCCQWLHRSANLLVGAASPGQSSPTKLACECRNRETEVLVAQRVARGRHAFIRHRALPGELNYTTE